jgi:RNA polymerase sigma-32 factor
VAEDEVVAMNRRMGMGGDASLNSPLREEGEGQWQDWLADDAPLADELLADDQEKRQRHALLADALATLNERERDILTRRRLADEPETLEELSQAYGVSRERVRQIEVRAFEKLAKAMHAASGQLEGAPA